MSSGITPADTAQRLREDSAVQYIDVRTVAEFAQGRPLLRAVNLPVVFHTPHDGAEVPNASFVDIVNHLFAPDVPLVIGGDADDRAERAAAALLAAGRTGVAVMTGGFAAWREALLPTTRDNRDGISYVSLLTQFRRKDKRGGSKSGAH
jgi:rhodanese-related sulfurtransferase